uniref:Uncharacterized protein n=1 Tax=Onchocerca volvulus TaxID=6282 RepID=A0A8R1XZW7_ONCVO
MSVIELDILFMPEFYKNNFDAVLFSFIFYEFHWCKIRVVSNRYGVVGNFNKRESKLNYNGKIEEVVFDKMSISFANKILLRSDDSNYVFYSLVNVWKEMILNGSGLQQLIMKQNLKHLRWNYWALFFQTNIKQSSIIKNRLDS